MGYFPNGTEGMMYEDEHCSHCVHQKPDDGGCPVWLAHMLHNYAECNKPDSILHLLIPLSADKLSNEACTMFVRAAVSSHETPEFEPSIEQHPCAKCGERSSVEVVGVLVCANPACKHQEQKHKTESEGRHA